jgi:hypothetical protein
MSVVVWRGPLQAPHFTAGRSGQKVDRIVLHTMTSWIAAADAHFKSPGGETSAHFGVRASVDEVWKWVEPWDTAHHCEGEQGSAPYWSPLNNERSIGIEHEDEGLPFAVEGGDPVIRRNVLYVRSSRLVAQFCREYGIPCVRGAGGPGIYDHRQVAATACPGTLDTERIIRGAQALLAAFD